MFSFLYYSENAVKWKKCKDTQSSPYPDLFLWTKEIERDSIISAYGVR